MNKALLLGLVLVVTAGCGSSAEPTTTTTTTSVIETTTQPPLDLAAHADGLLVGVMSEGEFAELDPPGRFPIGRGSGVVVSTDGLILTSATNVIGADRINIFLPGEEFPLVGELDAAAECVNLALVRVDRDFPSEAVFSGPARSATAAVADRDQVTVGPVSVGESDGAYRVAESWLTSGSVIFDDQGGVSGIVTAWSDLGYQLLLPGDVAASWVRQMRSREVVRQLGFSLVEDGQDRLVVAGLGPKGLGADLALTVGDVVTRAEDGDLAGGVAQLCEAVADGQSTIEVDRGGRRYVGAVPDEPLQIASRRTTEQIRQSVVKVLTDDGSGTGFFVSADGYVVTNYHVAGSHRSVSLRFDDDDDQIPATVVGASACADLAILQADAGEYGFLEWAPEPAILGEPIRVVGFPNRTETISFQEGIVSKQTTDNVWWGGFLSNFESSAQIDRGNSGGPVVNDLGEVLGVVYSARSGSLEGVWEGPHLSGVEAKSVVEDLVFGLYPDPGFAPEDVIYGWADGARGNTIRVRDVRPGGPADLLGLQGGDEVVVFGSVVPRDDFSGYRAICDAVQTAGTDAVLDVVVWRSSTGSYWDGQFNGRPLSERPVPRPVATADGSIATLVPGRWTDLDEITDAEKDWIGFWVAPDLNRYFNQFGSAAGARLMWSYDLAEEKTTAGYLAGLAYAGKAIGDPQPFDDGYYEGHYQLFGFGDAVAAEYAVKRVDDPASPMFLLFVADAAHRVETTGENILWSLTFVPPSETP